MMEKQVTALNNTLINFFKGIVHNPKASSSFTVFGGCQICKRGNHLATTYPRLNEPRSKCAKCDMFHRTENCGIKCSFCSGLGHSKDRCWKKPKDVKSHSRAANFLKVLLNDEEATIQQLNKLYGNENLFSYTQVPRRRMHVDVQKSVLKYLLLRSRKMDFYGSLAPIGVVPTSEIAGDGACVNQDT